MIVAKRIIRTGLAVSHEPIHAAVPAIDRVLAHRVSLGAAALVDRRMMGMVGVRWAAKDLWPDLVVEETKFNQSKWVTFPRPLMTTTGYALSWYPEWRVVVYVRDW